MKDKDAEYWMQLAVKHLEMQIVIDLSARLPYGVKMQVEVMNGSDCTHCLINHTKPYLRSRSSMTDEERCEYNKIKCLICPYDVINYVEFDWLNSHYFDYRGFIEKGLALEAPAGMYNF